MLNATFTWRNAVPRRAAAARGPADAGRGLSCAVTRDPDLVAAALALRRAAFGGGAGPDRDAHDAACDHAVVRDPARPALGVLATARIGADWTAREFDLSVLTGRGLRPVEVGRVCVHPDHRGGAAGMALFAGVLRAARAGGAQALVGLGSFPGTDAARHMPALRALRAAALAPPEWRAVAHGPFAVPVAGEAPRAAMAGVPALLKAYLRAGAWVGDGACVDAGFGAVDVCVVLDMARLRLPAWAG